MDIGPPPPGALLAQEERALALLNDGLRDNAYLAQELDRSLEEALPSLPASRAEVVRADVLFPVRRQRQALLTQLAIAIQALAAVRLAQRSTLRR